MKPESMIPAACRACSHLNDLLIGLDTAECRNSPRRSPANDEPPLEILRSALPGIVRTYSPDQHIMLEGEDGEQFIGVLHGTVRCFRIDTNGRRHILRFAGPGTVVGLEFGGSHRYSIEALTRSDILIFPVNSADAAFETNPCARRAMVLSIKEELNQRERAGFRLAKLGSDERVADFLLEVSQEGAKPETHLEMSRRDLADHLGVTLETVSRSLHKLDHLGLIRLKDAHTFSIPDPEGLHDFVVADPEDSPRHCRVARPVRRSG